MRAFYMPIFLFVVTLSHAQWTQLTLNEPAGNLNDLFVHDADHVIVVGDALAVFRTADGGNQWTGNVSTASGNVYNNVDFVDNLTGYAATKNAIQSGSIYKTTNGGESWFMQSTGMSILNSVDFVSATTGFAAANNGIYKTTNSGTNWSYMFDGPSVPMNQILFLNENSGFAVGGNGAIYRTIDGGNNWNYVQSNTTQVLHSIHFVDGMTGWAVGAFGTIRKTTNGGTTWIAQSSNTSQQLNGIYGINANVAFAVGKAGTILYTEDGGTTWIAQISNTDEDLNEVVFADENTGYVVGNNGVVLKTSNAGLFVTEHPATSANILYPNPFVDSFTVDARSFDISEVSLRLYDISGKLVHTVEAIGNDVMLIELPNIRPGFYLYQLTGGFKVLARGKIVRK